MLTDGQGGDAEAVALLGGAKDVGDALIAARGEAIDGTGADHAVDLPTRAQQVCGLMDWQLWCRS